MGEAQRFFVLTQTDNLWKEHLQAIKFLQQAVGLRGYAQRDPLVEYKLEGYNLFLEMMAQIRRNVIYNVYVFDPRSVARQAGGGGADGAARSADQGAELEAAAAGNGSRNAQPAKVAAAGRPGKGKGKGRRR